MANNQWIKWDKAIETLCCSYCGKTKFNLEKAAGLKFAIATVKSEVYEYVMDIIKEHHFVCPDCKELIYTDPKTFAIKWNLGIF